MNASTPVSAVPALSTRAAPPHQPLTCRQPRPGAFAAFSLIELLVVVAIIAILASLLMPALGKLRTQGARTRAAGQVTSVANAVRLYRQTYGRFPGQTSKSSDGTITGVGSAITTKPVLDDLSSTANNARGIVFLDVKEGWLDNGELVDPWRRRLVIVMDEDGDGKVTATATCPDVAGASQIMDITNGVAVLSWGPKPEDKAQRLYSW